MKRLDVVVIGGGIVGCAMAYFLTRAGLKTLVVERDGIAGASSGASMGHLITLYGPDELYQLSRRSLELWKMIHREVGGFPLRETGCLWMGETEEDRPLLENLHSAVAGHGDQGVLVDQGELLRMEPALARDLIGGFFYPADAVTFPMQAAGALLGAAIEGGAEVMPHCAVRQIRRSSQGAIEGVITSSGTIETDNLVIAAGVWSPEITEMVGLPRAPIFPRRGDLAITMCQHQPIKHQLVEVAYLRAAMGETLDPESGEPDPGACAVNLQPQSNGTLLIGSSRQFSGMDLRVNRRLLEQSMTRAARFLPGVGGLNLVRTWAGLRPYTKDKTPIIGPVAEVPGLFIASGHEGLGITLSTGSAELIAQAIVGETTRQSLTPFLLDRFSEAG